jgi:hypothetical protein
MTKVSNEQIRPNNNTNYLGINDHFVPKCQNMSVKHDSEIVDCKKYLAQNA